MAKGASNRSGRAPDPDALRRDRDAGSWVDLPAEGRAGDAPEWPLSEQSERERVFWEREWRRPQAVMWERNGQEVEVAVYVRSLALAEDQRAPVNARTLVRQQMEALGISVPGLQRNRWRIKAAAEPQTEQRRTPSTRGRLKLVG
jgi:hypothetical protein